MKKVIFAFLLMGLVSCNSGGEGSEPTTDSTGVISDTTVVVDTTNVGDGGGAPEKPIEQPIQ